VAEWVPSADERSPGTIVVTSSEKLNEVSASGRAYGHPDRGRRLQPARPQALLHSQVTRVTGIWRAVRL
jgi:hypothetical protein